MKIIKFVFLFQFAFSAVLTAGEKSDGIYINEFMASNYTFVLEPDFNTYEDWIEIYNAGDSSVNLLGYFLTDDLLIPDKWEIQSEVIVIPNDFVIFWADGINQGVHTNFKLSKSGEAVGIFSPTGELIDSIIYTAQQSDISFGRFPDGVDNFYFMTTPTPGNANNDTIFSGIVPTPDFSVLGGFYNNSVSLDLGCTLDSVGIYFTTDGSVPSTDESQFNSSIVISETSVIRAAAFREGFLPSEIVTHTFFINEVITLPVISIATNPENFWDDEIGIYVAGTNGIPGNCTTQPRNWNQDWERPISLEFFETDKSLAFKLDAGVKINGACSRLYPQKSLAIFARDTYGTQQIDFQIFKDKPIFNFKNFILRSSAQDWWRTMFRDGMIQTIVKQGTNVDYQAYRPSVVFLNGDFWGIHNIREKLNEHYLVGNHGVEPDNIDLIELSKAINANYGDRAAYDHLLNFASTNDMTLDVNYEYVKTLMDVEEYIDYQSCEIFAANADWPSSNVKLWREKNPFGKFRWMIYDLDFGFGGNAEGRYFSNTLQLATDPNGPDWPNPPWSTLLFRRMLTNENFRNEFIQKFAVHVNTTFDSTHALAVIDSIKNLIALEIPRHKEKWTQSISYGPDWDSLIEVMREFTRLRPEYVRDHFHNKFNLSGSSQLSISTNNSNAGFISAHNKKLTASNFNGVFFNDVPLELEAVALSGYRFVSWQGLSNSTDPAISVVLSEDSQLTALFESDSTQSSTIVINEINYNSSPNFNPEDWVELFNNADTTIDLSGWILKDEDETPYFTFPGGTILDARKYIVICRDTVLFRLFFPNVINVIGNFGFGLSGGGDKIRLLDSQFNIIDSVQYDDELPWPPAADGTGPTLELKNPNLDNSLFYNWAASPGFGSPGRLNDIFTEVQNITANQPEDFSLEQNYPNPFNPITKIKYSIPQYVGISDLPDELSVQLVVYDILGNKIATLVDEPKPPGVYVVEFNAVSLSSGIYFYRLMSYLPGGTGHCIITKKMVLLK